MHAGSETKVPSTEIVNQVALPGDRCGTGIHGQGKGPRGAPQSLMLVPPEAMVVRLGLEVGQHFNMLGQSWGAVQAT